MIKHLDIRGNQESAAGNPVPYMRMTQRSMWNPGAKRYMNWQHFVRLKYVEQCDPSIIGSVLQSHKPINLATGEKAYMHIMIHWANHHHGDPDNVWKGIADSLFANDKHVSGSFDYVMADDGKGLVEVQIIIE